MLSMGQISKYYGKVLHPTNQRQTELNVSMITFHANAINVIESVSAIC
jgi:hypothetical protein